VNNLKYKFELKPIFVIANVRKNSPADIAGFQKEDVIIKINKKERFHVYLRTNQRFIEIGRRQIHYFCGRSKRDFVDLCYCSQKYVIKKRPQFVSVFLIIASDQFFSCPVN